jgi:ATP-binding cassette subfamily C protein CydCD
MASASNSPRLRALLLPTGPERKRGAQAVTLGITGQLAAIGLLASSAWLISTAALRPPVLTLTVAIAAVRMFALLRGTARYGERLASHDLALSVLARVRVFAFERLEPLVPSRLSGGRRGDLLSRFVSDVDGIQDLYVRAAVPLVGTLATAAISVLVAFLLDPNAGLVLGLGLLVGALILPPVTTALGTWGGAGLGRERGARDALLVEAIHGASEIAVFGADEAVLQRLAKLEGAVDRQARQRSVAEGVGQAMGVALGGLLAAATVAASLPALDAGQISGVTVAVLGFLALASADVVAGLPEAFSTMGTIVAGARRVWRMPSTSAAAVVQRSAQMPTALDFKLEQVVVSFDHRRSPALAGVNLELRHGCHLALIGGTGAGKTTIANLLLGFLDPDQGRVTLGGVDLRRLDPEATRRLIAWAPQDPHIFHTTVAGNLRLACPNASDERLAAALHTVGLSPWLARLPEGLSQILGDRGTTVSGGERQRLGVARALLSDRAFLLLDEPTAHLDAAAEAGLRRAVLASARGRTLLWITHRQLGLDDFDRVVKVDCGHLATNGARPSSVGI